MGCRYSQPKAKTRSFSDIPDMADGLPEPSPPAPTDPRLPLNARQVFKLKKSWKGIKRCMAATGVEIFVRMFKKNKEIQSMFENFRELKTDDELRMNEALEKHATIVMGIVDDVVENIHNVDIVLEALRATTNTHMKIEGFCPNLFWNVEQPFLDAVRITLGDRYTDNMDAIYKITIRFILENLSKGASLQNDIS